MPYYLASSAHSGWDQFFIAVSISSDPTPQILITLLCFVILYIKNYKLEAICCIFNIGTTAITNLTLKNALKIPRPSGTWLTQAHGYGFPSGHASISTAIGIVLIYFIITRIRNKKVAFSISTFLVIYLILVGVSRVYVGVHNPTDVVGGWLISIVWSYISIMSYNFCIEKGVNTFLDKHFTINLNFFRNKSNSI